MLHVSQRSTLYENDLCFHIMASVSKMRTSRLVLITSPGLGYHDMQWSHGGWDWCLHFHFRTTHLMFIKFGTAGLQ
jgi:hypothetical protein